MGDNQGGRHRRARQCVSLRGLQCHPEGRPEGQGAREGRIWRHAAGSWQQLARKVAQSEGNGCGRQGWRRPCGEAGPGYTEGRKLPVKCCDWNQCEAQNKNRGRAEGGRHVACRRFVRGAELRCVGRDGRSLGAEVEGSSRDSACVATYEKVLRALHNNTASTLTRWLLKPTHTE